mmetsp:Transcript_31703/g.65626  ORF Transcript_31703/g.65626 Transcript_31703/m.65626 type:complete len:184 (-) Transcript_31703:45-596(-)|eukprot:CAMPEP_0181324426 /NCGR_PEP_ID=MMETSP1101-20121128/20353_1 /TAXON_ID=46948 /ORGANISM="Rhodomonas abbreviata, Strain Caron Lab Isolate" /LENGTH=183 /DNA_ID=CAMNT_0023432601 /DNA_START=294 /DNA_END=845 /DNA_ORIENTATION=-
MFFHIKKLSKNLSVDPKDYGPQLTETIKRKLTMEVENTCSEKHGFILKAFNIDIERLEGRINPTGMHPGGTAVFKVPYDAIVFKPFRGEVLNAIVKTSAQQGLFAFCGPLQVFIAKTNLSNEDNKLLWNADASPPCWMSEDQRIIIRDGSQLRVRIIGIRMSSDLTTSAVGTILDDYLGPIDS